MNLRDAKAHVLADFDAGNAVILKSPPGYGKTDFIQGLLKAVRELYPNENIGFGRAFMATQSSINATGLPWKSERDYGDGKTYTITDPAIPTWFISTEGKPLNMYDRALMVFEEWGQGDSDTKKAFAPILLEGGVPGFYLPPGSFRIALTNVDARDGVGKEFDFIIGRRKEYTVDGDVDVWIEDFADHPYQYGGKQWQTMPATKAWAKANPLIMFEAKPEKQGPWCNPRSLCMVDRYLQSIAKQNKGEIPLKDPLIVSGMVGGIGMAATQSFINTLKFRMELPSYEDIVSDPQNTKIPTKADLLMLITYELAGRTQPGDVGPVLAYVSRLPPDLSVTFVSALLRRDYKNIIQLPPMQAWVNKNASLLSIIVGLSK